MLPTRFVCVLVVALGAMSFTDRPQPARVSYQTNKTSEDLTVTYTIELTKTRKRNIGIGETYNGGTKTIFVSNGLARLRLVSLMRMQSIFILPTGNAERTAAIVKESGKNKNKVYLSATQWKQYNSKYDQATCRFTEDTALISGYSCNKAIITLTDGRTITAFYTKNIQRAELATVEPVFACIPGLVLKYTYEYKKGKITYTATAVSKKQIDQDILRVPAKGYPEQPYKAAAGEKEG
jgi:GLPGLI family protein